MSLFELLFNVAAEHGDNLTTNRGDVRQVESRVARLRVDASTAIGVLAQENDRLRLYCAALARLLLKKGIITLEELSTTLDAVDAEDGFKDGKLQGRPLPAERPMIPGRRNPLPKGPVVPKPVGKRPEPPKGPPAKPPKGWKPKTPPPKGA